MLIPSAGSLHFVVIWPDTRLQEVHRAANFNPYSTL